MKNIIKLTLCGLLFAITGCSNEFTQQKMPLVTTPEDVYSSAENIESALLGCYRNFKNTGSNAFLGGKMYAVFDSRGDDFVNISNYVTLQQTYEMTVNSTSTENTNFWLMAYYSINTCNLFIDDMAANNTVEILGQELYDQYITEAKFLRAYAYYVLCQLYSQPYSINPQAKAVPLRLTGLSSSGHNDCPRSTISDIYNTILTDLTPDALNDAPGTFDGVTRASKAAAHMLRMRIYMAMEKWGDAITEGNAITGYDLADDVTDLYGTDTYNNPEMIFALPMTDQDTPNTQLGLVEYYSPDKDICSIDTEAGIMSIDGYNNPADSRIADLTSESGGYLYTLKYTNQYKLDWVPMMRYAETLLNLAECYANQSGGAAQAKAALSKVRSRSLAEADDDLDINALSGDELLTAIYNERRLELLGEGVRGIDIMRRGETFVKGNESTPFRCNVAPNSTYYTWPIPQSEIAYNKAIND